MMHLSSRLGKLGIAVCVRMRGEVKLTKWGSDDVLHYLSFSSMIEYLWILQGRCSFTSLTPPHAQEDHLYFRSIAQNYYGRLTKKLGFFYCETLTQLLPDDEGDVLSHEDMIYFLPQCSRSSGTPAESSKTGVGAGTTITHGPGTSFSYIKITQEAPTLSVLGGLQKSLKQIEKDFLGWRRGIGGSQVKEVSRR